MHEEPAPAAIRRGMALTDAVFDGIAILDGITARRVDLSPALGGMLAAKDAVLVTVAPFPDALKALAWSALIDARLRKRAIPEPQRGLAPLTIGIGPNFVAGETVDYRRCRS
jgi:xanthine dehydrogenase accessory factor